MSRRQQTRRTLTAWLARAWPGQVSGLPAHPVAILLGLAVGWQWSGMQRVLAAVIDPLPTTATMVAAIALLTAALGPWLPERLVLGIARLIRRRSRRTADRAADDTGTFWMLRAVRERDESLMWLALAVLATGAGLVSLITLGMTRVVAAPLYHHLLDRFFWTNLTLAALEWSGVALLIGLSWVIHGLMATLLAPVLASSSRSPRDPTGVVAGILLGLGMAWLIHEAWTNRGLSGRQEFLAGVLVMFLLAGVAAWLSQRMERLRRGPPEAEADPPELIAGAEGLIWLSLVVWGIAAVLVGAGWLACRPVGLVGASAIASGVGGYTLVTAIGMAAASFHTRRRKRSASGCGMAAWTAGVGAGVVATLTAHWPAGTAASVSVVLLIALPFGYALHYAERAWLARVGSETLGFAQLTSAIMGGLGIGLIAVRWWALPMLGSMGTMTAGALLMLATGGLMQIYENHRPARVRHLRLALVFASLAAAIVAFPSDVRRWSRWAHQHRAPTSTTLGLDWLATRELPSARRICLIGLDPAPASRWLALGPARVDIMPLGIQVDRDAPPLPRIGRTRILHMSAFRTFRLQHLEYDLVYQRCNPRHRVGRFAEYSIEWLGRLSDRTLSGGQVIIDVPVGRLTPEAIAIIAATFRHAMPGPTCWTLIDRDGQPGIRLATNARSARTVKAGEDTPWAPVEWLLAGHPRARPHSIERDRITRALRSATAESATSTMEWLHHCRSRGPVADGSR